LWAVTIRNSEIRDSHSQPNEGEAESSAPPFAREQADVADSGGSWAGHHRLTLHSLVRRLHSEGSMDPHHHHWWISSWLHHQPARTRHPSAPDYAQSPGR